MFAHDGNQFRIVQRQRVPFITPVKDRARTVEGRAAEFRLELRDDKDEVLFQSDIARLLGRQENRSRPMVRQQQHIGPVSQRRFRPSLCPTIPKPAQSVCLRRPHLCLWRAGPPRPPERLRASLSVTIPPGLSCRERISTAPSPGKDQWPQRDRWNLVPTGDGYAVAELAKYHSDVQQFVLTLRATATVRQIVAGYELASRRCRFYGQPLDDPVDCPDWSRIRRDSAHLLRCFVFVAWRPAVSASPAC